MPRMLEIAFPNFQMSFFVWWGGKTCRALWSHWLWLATYYTITTAYEQFY